MSPRAEGPSDLVFAVVLGGLIGVLALGWASLSIACALSGAPVPGMQETGSAIATWAAHPSAPAAGLPGAGRDLAAWRVYAALGVLVLVLVALVLVIGERLQSGRSPSGSGASWWRRGGRGARWARRGDLSPTTVGGPEKGRVMLGRAPGGLVASALGESVLVAGPPRSGKSAGIAIPALLEWQGPVICTSVKPDLVDATIARRFQLGEALVFDPTMTASYPIAGWNPIHSCGTWAGARKLATRLALSGQAKASGDMDFWRRTTVKLLTPMFHAAHLTGRSMSDVLLWLDTQEREEIDEALEGCTPKIRAAAAANWARDPRQLSSIYTTAETVLEAFSDERVTAATSTTQITPEWLLSGNNTLYLVAPADEQDALRPVFATLVSELLGEMYSRATVSGQALDPRVLVLLDELCNVSPLSDLDGLATTGGGQGVQLVSVIHSIAQLVDRYGADRAANIASSHAAKVFLSGLSDERTLDWVKKIAGDEEVEQLSQTTSERRPSRTRSTTWRPLAPGNLVREQAPREALIVYRHFKPIRAKLRLYFEDSALTELARPSAAAAPTPARARRVRVAWPRWARRSAA